MALWYPDTCPTGQCIFVADGAAFGFKSALTLCPHHQTMALAFKHDEIFAAVSRSNQNREAARARAKLELGLDKEHPGVWYKTEADGSFTIGVDAKDQPMPEWPSAAKDKLALDAAIKETTDAMPKVPGMAPVNNGKGLVVSTKGTISGKALMVGSASGADGSFNNFFGSPTAAASEAATQMSCTEDANFTALRGRVGGGNSGTATIRFRDAGANGQNVATISGTGAYEDTTPHTDSLQAADLFDSSYADTGSNSTTFSNVITVEFASGHGCFYSSAAFGGRVFDVASSTRYIAISAGLPTDGEPAGSLANIQWKNRAFTSWEALQVRILSNARLNTSDFVNRINGSNGSGLCSFATLATGLVVDTTMGDALADGDLLDISITIGAGVEDLVVTFVGSTLKSTTGRSDSIGGQSAGVSRTGSATANYSRIGGAITALTSTDETANRVKVGFPAVIGYLRCYLSANTYAGDGTLKLFKNGSAVITLTLGAGGGAAWYENSTDFITVDVADELSLEWDEGTSGSITMTQVGLTFLPPLGALLSDKKAIVVDAGLVI